MGQVITDQISLEALSASAPIIVIARRTNDAPYEFTTSDIVVRPNQEEERVEYPFTVWSFEIVEAIKYRYHSPLESTIGVIQAGVQNDYEVYLDSMRGMSTTYREVRYRAEPELTLDSIDAEPIVLFLSQGYLRIDDAPRELAEAFQLYTINSIEHLARKDDVVTMSTAPFDDGEGPPPRSPVED